jgi:hypothetical protein
LIVAVRSGVSLSIRCHVGIDFVRLSRLLVRVCAYRFCVVLMIGCRPAKALGVDLRLLGVRISPRRLCLAFPGSQLVFFGLLPHFTGSAPISLAFAPSCENADYNHNNDHNDYDDNNRNHSA